jgi:hypothetical protein
VVWGFGSVAQPWRRCSRGQASPIGLGPRAQSQSAFAAAHCAVTLALSSTTCAGQSSVMPASSVLKSRKWASYAKALPMALCRCLRTASDLAPDVVPSLRLLA